MSSYGIAIRFKSYQWEKRHEKQKEHSLQKNPSVTKAKMSDSIINNTTQENLRKKSRNNDLNASVVNLYEQDLSKNTKYRLECTLDNSLCTKFKKDNILTAIEILLAIEIKSEKIHELGFQKIGVDFDSKKEANNIVTNQDLSKKGLTANISFRCVYRRGVIKSIEENFDLETLKWEGVSEELPIYKAERICITIKEDREIKNVVTRNVIKNVATRNVIITSKGEILPERKYLYGVAPTRVHLFMSRVRICYNCFSFGHTSALCKKPKKCKIVETYFIPRTPKRNASFKHHVLTAKGMTPQMATNANTSK